MQTPKDNHIQKYDITIVECKKDKNVVYNVKYNDQIVSKDPITIIKSMNKKQPYGKYKLVAYCCINGMMYGLSSDGKLYNSNRTWKDCYTESSVSLNELTDMITEYYNEIKSEMIYNEIMNNFYNSLGSLIYC